MMVGGSYRSRPNFTAGNDVEPGVFCGQAAARRATYRLGRVGDVTNIFQICRAPTVTLTMECKRLFMRIKKETWIKWIKALFINGLNE